ncbi:MAG TPA: TMEM165/GDT1 family protein [Desulfobacterales bacterium]|nr:TMEM165/GDT1 family protein [Desulfobacterales bacterium]
MDIKAMLSTFALIFLAELGDKTQLATLSFAASGKSRFSVFIGAAGALVLTSLLAVSMGSLLVRWVDPSHLRRAAAILFIFLGIWMLLTPPSGK